MSHIPENGSCADCKTRGATWVSLEFGVLICINCSGVHRSFGMQITRIRSSKLDNWKIEDAKHIELVGNMIANNYWEHSRRDKKNIQVCDAERTAFIRQKYITKLWVKKGVKDPVSYIKENGYNVKREQVEKMYCDNSEVVNTEAVSGSPKSIENSNSLKNGVSIED